MRTWKKYSIYKEDLPYETFSEKREESNPETADGQKGKKSVRRVCSPCTLHGFRNDYRLCCQRPDCRRQQPLQLHLRSDTGGRDDYARLRHRAGRLVAEIPRPVPEGERLPHTGGRRCDYLCERDFNPHHRLIQNRLK